MALYPPTQNRETLGETAYRKIRDDIISLRLQPGQMVYENELASALGMSRTPVREALLALQREEFIEILPQRGARVAYISEKKVEEARSLREILEVHGFIWVAEAWDEELETFREAGREIDEILRKQAVASETGDYIAFLDLDEAFHQSILELTSNATLVSIVTQLRGHLKRMRYLELKEALNMETVVQQHRDIFAALRAGNAEETASLLKHHFRQLQYNIPSIVTKYSRYFTRL
jgi:DNA-binding GntR family transcriptional regulator